MGVQPVSDGPASVGLEIEEELAAALTLREAPGFADRGMARLRERFGTLRAALDAPPWEVRSVVGRAPPSRRVSPEDASGRLRSWRSAGLRVVVAGAPGYPERLGHLGDPPAILFLRGDTGLLDRPMVAVVGSRKATEYGRRISAHVAEVLARAGIVVASGLALGADGAAHRGALRVGGGTIAVLATGIDVPHPPSHRALFAHIAKEGLLVSEFLPGEPPLPHNFPRRNRVLAALAVAVVVVEAASRSGASITVDHALDLGREVFAVPGPVDSPQSRGTHEMIRDGAAIVTDPAELVDALWARPGGALRLAGWQEAGSQPAPPALDGAPRRLWEALDPTPRSVEELVRRSGLASGAALAALTTLELGGWAVRFPGTRFARPPHLGGSGAVGDPGPRGAGVGEVP